MKLLYFIAAIGLVGLGFERILFAQSHTLSAMPMGGYTPVIALGIGLIICGAVLAMIGSRAK